MKTFVLQRFFYSRNNRDNFSSTYGTIDATDQNVAATMIGSRVVSTEKVFSGQIIHRLTESIDFQGNGNFWALVEVPKITERPREMNPHIS